MFEIGLHLFINVSVSHFHSMFKKNKEFDNSKVFLNKYKIKYLVLSTN